MQGAVLKIGILGCRGIPNHYGGFEQFAQHLSHRLVENGHRVWVYQSSLHPFERDSWEGVNLIRQYDPEDKLGAFGQFIYDFNCLSDARKREFDILLQLGYTSNAIWFPFWPKNAANIIHMDGFEWKRSKYIRPVRYFLKLMEGLAVRQGDALVVDSPVIQSYITNSYGRKSFYIPYGVSLPVKSNLRYLEDLGLSESQYFLVIARIVPENNLETIIEGFLMSDHRLPLVIVGNTATRYAHDLVRRYKKYNILFCGSIYNQGALDSLRRHCALYFHGHSVGGTNPSLLEAMAHEIAICAHDNPFNRSVLGKDAFYFGARRDISDAIKANDLQNVARKWGPANYRKIKEGYQWSQITSGFEELFYETIASNVKLDLVLKNEKT